MQLQSGKALTAPFRAWVGMVASIALLLSVGCSKPETRVSYGDRHQILYQGNAAEPQDIDPQAVSGVPEHFIIVALFEGLVSEDPKDLHAVPGVAERWDITDEGKTYTFHLRHNARWSDG